MFSSTEYAQDTRQLSYEDQQSSGWVNKRHYNFKLVLNSEEQGSDLGNQPNTLHRSSHSVTTTGETAEFCHRLFLKSLSKCKNCIWSLGNDSVVRGRMWLRNASFSSLACRSVRWEQLPVKDASTFQETTSAVELVHVIMTSGWRWGHQKGIFEAEVPTRSRRDSTQEPSTCLVTV